MTYVSPFGSTDAEHEWPDAMCLSRTHCTDAPEQTLQEFYAAAVALIGDGIPQPAFFVARQLAELSLKALLGPGRKHGHDLAAMLRTLEDQGDDLFSGADDRRRLVVEFVRGLHRHDPKGDQGRYATTAGGTLSLATVCCAEPARFRECVDNLYFYTHDRLGLGRTQVV